MTRLSVNIDHIATIRQARRTNEPDPVTAAAIVELAGAHGVTVHLRGDRRHISDRDLRLLRETVKTKLNVEMAATEDMVAIALETAPDQVTLVPELPAEITTTGGLDCAKHRKTLAAAAARLEAGGIIVSAFIDPDEKQIRAANAMKVGSVELNTARYSDATLGSRAEGEAERVAALNAVKRAARLAASLGMKVLAGHGLTYRNVGPIVRIPEIVELNIGHNLVARASLVGLDCAVRDMLAAMADA
jgi:pyridoxine 5-phosphate synthase